MFARYKYSGKIFSKTCVEKLKIILNKYIIYLRLDIWTLKAGGCLKDVCEVKFKITTTKKLAKYVLNKFRWVMVCLSAAKITIAIVKITLMKNNHVWQ